MAHALKPTERGEQRAVVGWLRLQSIRFTHVPNFHSQIRRRGKVDYRALEARRKDGVQDGHPDLVIYSTPRTGWTPLALSMVDRKGLSGGPRGVAIEMKAIGGDKPTEAQLGWLVGLEHCGWIATWCRGADTAILFLQTLGFGRR